MRGIVKAFDSQRGIGIIHGKNGRKYPVTLADVVTVQPLKTGQLVLFSVRFVNNHGFATNVGIPPDTGFKKHFPGFWNPPGQRDR